ncbi:PaaI family thioesterase [Gordonia pseudamarae]|uniref:Acyl-coenzyme A thioesterase THEM4 n=1 Tax=Gordonia pseudamarae TaxID=2831662 RepID=A0ABX6IEU4_9ACTN|nr:PaaI family thioesterase [Gordonia pseudamarae]QHN25427.1 PaaI family thioesterase [Gordonia pseudamarae]QHN34359.1 PaaI family thioesterase [Gordonia pseudamarae]
MSIAPLGAGRTISEVISPTWTDLFGPTTESDDEFAALTGAVSALQEAFTRCDPPPEVAAALAHRLHEVAGQLRSHETAEDDQLCGRLWDRPGRGQVMAPALHVDEVTGTTARGHFTIERFHSGRYALNGGVTPMIFDEIMSRLGNSLGLGWARTANLSVDYRSPAPLYRKLTATAEFVRQDGRKRYLAATITDDRTLIAEATGLWVLTTPGTAPEPQRRN